jgi:hypothetical protein
LGLADFFFVFWGDVLPSHHLNSPRGSLFLKTQNPVVRCSSLSAKRSKSAAISVSAESYIMREIVLEGAGVLAVISQFEKPQAWRSICDCTPKGIFAAFPSYRACRTEPI